MPSDVEICNLALTKLGQQRILTMLDNVKAARSLNAIYAMERDSELRAHHWSFALARATLAALTAVPTFGYNHAFQLPSDFLRLIQAGDFSPGGNRVIGVVSDGSDYRIEGPAILTDIPAPLHIRYMRKITDPTLFDPCFVKAFACRLAMELAEDLTQVANKRQLAAAEYKQAIIDAIRANAIELPPDPLPDGSWALSRLPG